MFYAFFQEYRARKRQKLQKKIGEHLQQSIANASANTSSVAAQDLVSMVTEISNKSSAGVGKIKGSRFTHTEKLQFAQVKQ